MRHLPNLITLANLFCGFLALEAIFHSELEYAGKLVIVAAILDFLDGFAARLLKAYSDIGKQLDSLADMVTFGLVPGVMLYSIFRSENAHQLSPLYLQIGQYSMLIVTLFSALRYRDKFVLKTFLRIFGFLKFYLTHLLIKLIEV